MLSGALAACTSPEETTAEQTTADKSDETTTGEKTPPTEEQTTVAPEESVPTDATTTPDAGESDSASETDTDSTTDSQSETESETETETETETESDPVTVEKIESPHDDLIQTANGLANGVQAYFPSAKRTHYTLANQNMSMNYARSNSFDQLVESIKNTQGVAYIQNTMDVFVRMVGDSETYYASQSNKSAEANLYRFGYYYYEAFFEYQDFIPKSFELTESVELDVAKQNSSNIGIKRGNEDGNRSFTINDDADPQIKFEKDFSYAAADYNTLVLRAKALGDTSGIQLFLKLDNGRNYSQSRSISFSLINDGEYHTYYISLYTVDDYTGIIEGIRLDPYGSVGGGVVIESMNLGKAETGNVPSNLSINRHFHVYSDKMHHAVQFAVTEKTENIAEIGMQTKIDANTVSKLIVVDKDGKTYDSLDAGFAWEDVAAVAFDVTEAGIFGFILPKYDDPAKDTGGKIKVELVDGVYVIEQTRVPSVDGVDGVIIPSIDTENRDKNGNLQHAEGVKNNGNDVYISQRVYTDESHDFSAFLLETHFERNPETVKGNVVSSKSCISDYAGYDPMRGIYIFNIETPAGGFYTPFNTPNKQYKINFQFRATEDRKIYVMTAGKGGLLECATLMDENMMLLPIPIEVIKNFSEATGERNLYNISDPTFSEAIFCLDLKKDGGKQEYNIINLYQNWGKYPLKQLSQIPFHCPYYHLSTGVTETNCILPWFGTASVGKSFTSSTLPDFRSMSAPYWAGQPQHNSCGSHSWLVYTDSEGGKYAVEATNQNITSYGPTYAEIVWENISDDGKIKVTYTHMEMPQVDENRSYYTMEYEFLDTLTINNFKDNFRFYNVTDNNAIGTYKKLGYLNEKNECVVVDSNQDSSTVPEYALGDECPYFSFFMMPDWNRESDSAEGYANVALLIYNSEFMIGGAEKDYGFLIKNPKDNVTLTLNTSETITFQAGDKITINAILLPWGSQQYEDDPANRLSDKHAVDYTDITYSTVLPDGTLYMDKNVRDVRENTLLNPLTVTSATDDIIDSAFLPKIKSKDGKTAEFTLSGGENNVTVRVYGFARLTAPKVEELVGDEWVEYVLSSKEEEANNNYYHYYDGYMVFADEDGTYSYSFVTTMHDGAPRKFRISADEEFAGWPTEKAPPAKPNLLNIYTDHEELHALVTQSSQMYGPPSINEEDGNSFVSVFVKLDNTSKESYSILHQSESEDVAGQYLVIKYRVPKTNKEDIGSFQIWASTETTNPADAGSFYYTPVADGDWHVDVIDLSKAGLKHYTTNESGEYAAQLLRVDIFNKEFTDATTHIDIEYFGIDSDLLKICELEQEKFQTITLVEGSKKSEIDTTNGGVFVKTYIDPSSGYTESTLPFRTLVDSINGSAVVLNTSSSQGNVKTYSMATVTKNMKITIEGWACVESGVNKYVWSADGGKTWIDFPNQDKLGNATDAMIENANESKITFTDNTAAKKNGSFKTSTTPLVLDLSAYEGQIVDVTIAAVPEADTSTLVLLYHFEKIDCSYESIFADESIYTEANVIFASQIDTVNGVVSNKQASNLTGFGTYTDITVRDDNTILLKGWAAVDGGVNKYVWTADNGATWNDCGGKSYAPANGSDGTCAIITVGQGRTDGTFADPEATKKNAGFQGDGITIDLSAYAGTTEPLDIYLCAVTESNQGKVVILYFFKGVVLPAAQ